MSRSPPPEKYASAFSPPFVSCLTLRRRLSDGSSTGEGLFAGLWPAENTAADRPKNSARGNINFVLINLRGTAPAARNGRLRQRALTLNPDRPRAKDAHRGPPAEETWRLPGGEVSRTG